MRDYVEARKQAVLERAIGRERAAKLGRRAQAKIVGGINAKSQANRFQVALLMASERNNYNAQYCGGSLYKPNIVVTAAHCSDFVRPSEVEVLTGTRRLDGSGTRRRVQRIVIHPNFDDWTLNNDVAILKLGSKANNIPLVRLAGRRHEPRSGVKLLATGWGSTGSYYPVRLRQVKVPGQPRSDCNDADSYNGAVTNKMICAGLDRGGLDTCYGDSGGPLTAKTGSGIRSFNRLVGITSWGDGCALPELFGVYTRVSRFKSWIISQSR